MKFLILILSLNLFSKSDILVSAPDFKINESKKLSDYKDHTVVLEWYNKDCPFVKKHYDSNNMQELKKKYTKKGIKWITILSSAKGKQGYFTKPALKEFLDSSKFASTHFIRDVDGKIGKMYNAKTTPHMFIIKNNHIVYDGSIDSISSYDKEDVKKAKNYVAMNLDDLIKGKKINNTIKTKPYGCSVKY